MPTANGWTLDLEALPGWDAAQWWEFFELSNADMAFVAYDIGEIGVSSDAGYLAVYRNKVSPVLALHPASWMVSLGVDSVRCDQTGQYLLIYVANSRVPEKRHALVDLERRQHAWVPIPNEAYTFKFHQIGDLLFENSGSGFTRSPTKPFTVDIHSLSFSDFVRQDGMDLMKGRIRPALIPLSKRE